MFGSNGLKIAGAVVSVSILAACNSKFVEKKSDSVMVSTNMSAIMQDKAAVDEKLNGVEDASKKIRRLNDLLKRAYSPTQKEAQPYTPVDFIIDVNEELKGSIPRKVGDKYVRTAIVEIQNSDLAPECKSVEAMLETSRPEALAAELAKTGKQNSEVLKYSIRTCGTDGQFLPMVEASWEGNQGLLSVDSKNITKILNQAASETIQKNWNCGVSNDTSGIIESIYCENLDLALSGTETAVVDSMNFSNKGSVRFEASARIFEKNQMKAVASIVLKDDGEVAYKLDKVESVRPAKVEKEDNKVKNEPIMAEKEEDKTSDIIVEQE